MIEEKLPEIPKDWTTATISELIDNNGVFIDGDWVESKDQDPSGDVRLVQLADIGDGVYRNKSNRFLTLEKAVQLHCTFLKSDDVLIARMPDPLGRACLFPGDPKTCVTVVDVCIVRLSSNFANNRWLMCAINSPAFRSNISSLQSGSTRKRISRGNLAKLKLTTPPLPEQRVIVSKIEQLFSDLDNGIANFKKAQEQLKRYRQSVLKNACEGKLVPTEAELARADGRDYEPADVLLARILKERREKWNGRGKYKEPAAPDTSGLVELPEGGCWANVGQIAIVGTGATPLTSKKEYYENGSIPWITSSALNEFYIKEPNNFVTEKALQETNISLYPKHTILVAMYGEGKTRGKCSELLIEATTNQAIAALVLNGTSGACRSFLKIFLINNYDNTRMQSSGGVQPNLNLGLVKKIIFPLPPLTEQRRIVVEVERRLSICDKMEATIAESLQKAESLRQSILKKAFEGKLLNEKELEETRNASDWEPAEKLLERIKAEKTNMKAKKKGKK